MKLESYLKEYEHFIRRRIIDVAKYHGKENIDNMVCEEAVEEIMEALERFANLTKEKGQHR